MDKNILVGQGPYTIRCNENYCPFISNVSTRSLLFQRQTTKNKCDFVETPKMWRPMGKYPLCPLGKSCPGPCIWFNEDMETDDDDDEDSVSKWLRYGGIH